MRFVDIEPDDPRMPEVFAVLKQLRRHLDESTFLDIYRRGWAEGLRFLALYKNNQCVAVAGWRFVTNTSAERKLYVDDLVTDETQQSRGLGHAILAELERRAVEAGCTTLDLDSGVQRFDAHRFYLRERMFISSYHFAKKLS
jgi:GNAT superfamily N-acetyltransferase